MGETTTTVDRDVVITFPAQSGFLGLCRVNVSAVGGMLGFDIDVLDDLRLAVTEAVQWLLDGAAEGAEATLRIGLGSKSLSFSATCANQTGAASEIDDLASAILGATVDAFDGSVLGGIRRIEFIRSVIDEQ
ncbi:MAG: hypothetical protein KJN63_05395 [Acidimicrobiia bacterium]|nr:hypothetical protein [Acidimicrobiia bacterium]